MNDLKRLIKSARYPAALTGAGISAPSGIPTFQGSYKGRPLRDYLTRDYMEDHPIDFFDLYCDMVKWCEKEPNLAHYALKELNVRVITQNIDGLHAKAGSTDALEMHGSLRFVLCHGCGEAIDTDVVLYSDAVRHLSEAIDIASSCDLFLVIGTSLVTYPAAGLPDVARQSGAKVIMINDDCIKAFSD